MLKERYDKGLTIHQRVSAALADIDTWKEQEKFQCQTLKKLGVSEDKRKKIKIIHYIKGVCFCFKDFFDVISGKDQKPDTDDYDKILDNFKYNPTSKHPGVNIEAAQEQFVHLKGQEMVTSWRAQWDSFIDESKASYLILAIQTMSFLIQKGVPFLGGFETYSGMQPYLLGLMPTTIDLGILSPVISITFELLSHLISIALGILSFEGIRNVPSLLNAIWRDFKRLHIGRKTKEFFNLEIVPRILFVCFQVNPIALLVVYFLVG